MLRALWRLLLGGLGLCVAIPFGGTVLGAGFLLDPALRGLLLDLIRAGLAAGFRELIATLSPALVLDAAVAAAKSLVLLVTLPPTLTAVVGETLRFRSLRWYAGASGLLAAALPWVARGGFRLPSGTGAQGIDARATALLFLAGAASGFAYWLVAGWSAGRARRRSSRFASSPRIDPRPPSHAGPPAVCPQPIAHAIESRTNPDQRIT